MTNVMDQRSHIKTVDGVITNCGNKNNFGESVVVNIEDLSNKDELPTYEQATRIKPPPYTDYCEDRLYDVESMYPQMPVGSTTTFILSFMVAAFIQVFGFVVAYVFSMNYSGKYGAIAGFSFRICLEFVQTLIIQKNLENPQIDNRGMDFIIFAMIIFISLFFYSIFIFTRMKIIEHYHQNNASSETPI